MSRTELYEYPLTELDMLEFEHDMEFFVDLYERMTDPIRHVEKAEDRKP